MGVHDRDYNRKRPPEPDDEGGFDPPDDAYDADPNDADADDDQDASDDPEAPDAADRDDGDEPAMVRCPNCRKWIVEDAERCPKCGHYVEDAELARERPTWVWVGIGLALLVAVTWAVFG